MSLVCWCRLPTCLLSPIRALNRCRVQIGPVHLTFASMIAILGIAFLCLETFVMIEHGEKSDTSKNDYKLRLILLGTKWRAERNFYMALVNCVVWLSVNFFGEHLDQLAQEQQPTNGDVVVPSADDNVP